MPGMDAAAYGKLEALARDPDITPETKARIEKAMATYAQEQQAAPQQQAAPIDPGLPVVPQALAMLPGTNHPAGDRAAQQEWLGGGEGSAAGAVFFYEPPVTAVLQKLTENPSLVAAAGLENLEVTPEGIAKELQSRGSSSDLYQAYADYEWGKAAEAATQAGRKAYRYSKAPWLHSGGAMSAIQTLGMKALGSVVPAKDMIDSYILGVDDTAALGASRAAAETLDPEQKARHAQLEEEHPAMAFAGKITGMLTPWGATSFAFGTGAKASQALAGPAAGLTRRALTSGVGAASAGAGLQAGSEAVDAAANLAQTGEAGTTAADAGGRVANAGLLAGGFGVGAELGGALAGAGARWVDRRFGGTPERALATGAADISPVTGVKLRPETEALIKRAEEMRARPGDVVAQDLDPKLVQAADEEVKEAVRFTTARKQAFADTREGQLRIPATNVVDRSLKLLRERHDRPEGGGALRQVGAANAETRKIASEFNANIAEGGVSFKPSEGAVKLDPQEAEAFLNNSFKQDLLDSLPKKARGSRSQGTFRVLESPPIRPWKPDSDKAYISDLYEATKGNFKSRADFDSALLKAHREAKGGILNRLDLVGAADKAKLSGSRIKSGNADYDLVNTEAAADFAKKYAPTKAQSPAAPKATEAPARITRDVYVTPRRFDAMHQQEYIDSLKGFRERNQGFRDLQQLDDAARMDRDLRPLDGKPGGWSALQAEHSRMIGAAKDLEKMVAPNGSAFKPLVQAQQSHPGELELVQAQQKAARRAGVLPEYEASRMLDPLMRLKEQTNWGPGPSGNRVPVGLAANIDAASIRAYPALRKLGGPMSPLRAGRGGALSTLAGNPLAMEAEDQ